MPTTNISRFKDQGHALDGPTPSESTALFLHYVRTQDQQAIEQLISSHFNHGYRQAHHLLGSASDAEDAVQNALIQLILTAPRFDGRITFPAWFGRLVQVAALQLRRSRGRRQRREREAPSDHMAPSAPDEELQAVVGQAISELPETLRMPISLHYLGGLSQQQTAEVLQISADALSMRLHRARERLRRALARSGIPLPPAVLSAVLGSFPALQPPAALAARCRQRLPSTGRPASGAGRALAGPLAAGITALACLGLVAFGSHQGHSHPSEQNLADHPAPARDQASIVEVPLPGVGFPTGLAALPDGTVWVECASQDPHLLCFYHLDHAGILLGHLELPGIDICSGRLLSDSKGGVWFSEASAIDRIGSDGKLSRYPVAYGHSGVALQDTPIGPTTTAPFDMQARTQLGAITLAPDGALWFTDQGSSSLGRFDVQSRSFSLYPTGEGAARYGAIVAAAGAIYCIQNHELMGMTPAGRPFQVTTRPALAPGHELLDLVAGPDHALWFIEARQDQLCRLATDGALSVVPLPSRAEGLSALAPGPDGGIAFCEARRQGGKVGVVSSTGMVTEWALPRPGCPPQEVTTAPDGTLWILESGARRLARLER